MASAPTENLTVLNANPPKSPVIYHYCSTDIFWSIIERKEFWLSDIFLMNDALELKWGRDIFTKVIRENHGLFDDDFRYVLSMHIFGIDPHVRPFTGSFSADGDLPSQWRDYADDGRGFALGLSAPEMNTSWGVRLKKIEYRQWKQEQLILTSLRQLQELWRTRPSNDAAWQAAWSDICYEFGVDLCGLKHPKFAKEKEYRVIRLTLVQDSGGAPRYTDPGGRKDNDDTIAAVPVQKRMRAASEISYVALPTDAEARGTIVRRIVLGLNNPASPDVVRSRVKAAGFHGFKLERSSKAYP